MKSTLRMTLKNPSTSSLAGVSLKNHFCIRRITIRFHFFLFLDGFNQVPKKREACLDPNLYTPWTRFHPLCPLIQADFWRPVQSSFFANPVKIWQKIRQACGSSVFIIVKGGRIDCIQTCLPLVPDMAITVPRLPPGFDQAVTDGLVESISDHMKGLLLPLYASVFL